MSRRILLLFLASTLGLFAQGRIIGTPFFRALPPELRQYLALTDTQADAVTKLFDDNQLLVSEKSRRMAQVQSEIAEELNKDPLDPMSIGVRYAEIEAIRRGLDAESKRMRVAVRAVLTDPQKVKLKTLEEARKLSPTISAAECYGFLDPMQTALPRISGSAGFSFTTIPILSPYPPTYSGCGYSPTLTFTPGPADQPTQK